MEHSLLWQNIKLWLDKQRHEVPERAIMKYLVSYMAYVNGGQLSFGNMTLITTSKITPDTLPEIQELVAKQVNLQSVTIMGFSKFEE